MVLAAVGLSGLLAPPAGLHKQQDTGLLWAGAGKCDLCFKGRLGNNCKIPDLDSVSCSPPVILNVPMQDGVG